MKLKRSRFAQKNNYFFSRFQPINEPTCLKPVVVQFMGLEFMIAIQILEPYLADLE